MRKYFGYLTSFIVAALFSGVIFYFLYSMKISNLIEDRYGFGRIADLLEKADNEIELPGKKGFGSLEDKVFQVLLAEQADRIVAGHKSDRDKALALAEWVGTHWRGHSNFPAIAKIHESRNLFQKYAVRAGACGTRSGIFVYLAELVGLQVKRFSIHNFGNVGLGHTAAQVFYDDDWHFFDVTYSGYFEKDGNILSFEKILEHKESVLDYLVAFGHQGQDANMRRVYSPDKLKKAFMHGFVGDPTPITLHFQMIPGDRIGQSDGSNGDVFHDERQMKKSEQLEKMGFSPTPFFHRIKLENLSVGQHYKYIINFYSDNLKPEDTFFAKCDHCQIVSGTTLNKGSKLINWEILLIAKEKSCVLELSHNIFVRGRRALVDSIVFE